VRAFAIEDAVDIALVVMAASGYLSGLTIRAPAVPSIAITQTLALFVPLLIAAGIHPGYWSVAVLLLCHTIGSINLIMTMNRRILSQLMAEHDLAQRAATDALTGAVSRAAFDAALTERMARGSPTIALIDLDRFKPVNDTYGHAVGDELLKAVVDRVRAVLAGGHVVARIGGDEFAVLFDDIDIVEATDLAEAIVTALEQPFALASTTVEIGASVGMAVAVAGDTAQSLRQRADERLYDAKREGRGRVAPARSREAA
jgi:diguanylate cyclase (GGDEF)-like protein